AALYALADDECKTQDSMIARAIALSLRCSSRLESDAFLPAGISRFRLRAGGQRRPGRPAPADGGDAAARARHLRPAGARGDAQGAARGIRPAIPARAGVR